MLVNNFDIVNLEINESVDALSTDNTTYTPPAGSAVTVRIFSADAFYDKDSHCRLVWKYDHATETEDVKWTIYGSGETSYRIVIPSTDTDGVRKLAIVLDNGTLIARKIAGRAILEVVS